MPKKSEPILAAGCVVFRGKRGHWQVLVVHRPRYDDWSLPKGKRHADEYVPVTATRETREETGYRVRLRTPLSPVDYEVNSGTKRVYWFLAELVSEDRGKTDDEVDDVAWWPVEKAVAELTQRSDVDVLTEALRFPRLRPFIIVRHAKAMPRKSWKGNDADRRLVERGRRQSRAISGLLEAFGVGNLASSSSNRCVKTLMPYATEHSLEITRYPALSEEAAQDNPKGVAKAMREILKTADSRRLTTAVCGHRPVLPSMYEAMGLDYDRTIKPAEMVLVLRDDLGKVRAAHAVPPCL